MAKANAKTADKPAKNGRAQKTTASAETATIEQVQPAASGEQRQQTIAERAYQKAAARGFAPGSEEHDWLEAEREVEWAQADEATASRQ